MRLSRSASTLAAFLSIVIVREASSENQKIKRPPSREWVMNQNGNPTGDLLPGDIVRILLPFHTSRRDHGAQILRSDCITPFDNDSYFFVSTSTPVSDKLDGFIKFNTNVDMNITTLRNTKYWNPFTDGSRGGWVEACLETYLYFTDKYNLNPLEKVNFVNNVLNVSVSLHADFKVDGVKAEREEAKMEKVDTDFSDQIIAYECEANKPYVNIRVENNSQKIYSQGDKMTICVTDTSAAGNGIVQVDEVNRLTVSQVGARDYHYIRDSFYIDKITTQVCEDGASSHVGKERSVCLVRFTLLSHFFHKENPANLKITGSVYVVRDGQRVHRNLRMELPPSSQKNEGEDDFANSSRRVEIAQGSGEFALDVTLGSASSALSTALSTSESAASSNYGSKSAGLVYMVVGTALMVQLQQIGNR